MLRLGAIPRRGRIIKENIPLNTKLTPAAIADSRLLYQQILYQGVERGIASDLIDEIKRIPDSQNLLINGDLNRQLCSIIEEMGAWADKNTFVNGKSKIVALLGTAGVGKTTTIAKLAAVHDQPHKEAGCCYFD